MKLLLLFILYYMQWIGSWTKGDFEKYGPLSIALKMVKCEYLVFVVEFIQKTCCD